MNLAPQREFTKQWVSHWQKNTERSAHPGFGSWKLPALPAACASSKSCKAAGHCLRNLEMRMRLLISGGEGHQCHDLSHICMGYRTFPHVWYICQNLCFFLFDGSQIRRAQHFLVTMIDNVLYYRFLRWNIHHLLKSECGQAIWKLKHSLATGRPQNHLHRNATFQKITV